MEQIYKGGIMEVLNLIITGIPSIQVKMNINFKELGSFKPYYNWNTFNTNQ